MGRITTRHPVRRINLDGGERNRADTVAVEEPLEIRVDGQPLTITMRTPGHDTELVHGFLRGEGVITVADDVATARYCAGTISDGDGYDQNTYNVLDVRLRPGARPLPVSAQRSLVMHGGCGLCGKTSIDAIAGSLPHGVQAPHADVIRAEVIAAMPERMRAQQSVFARTGGTHAAALFTPEGEALVVREDIGRHNAVDKVIGWATMADRPLTDDVLVVSSRASFEIVQKAAMAGVGTLAAVSAPSSLALEAAEQLGITLVAFVRGTSLNVYTHGDRLASST